jgi:4-amino-4-deoxy-L-arabinose transferase-like glycosyltransferase
MRFKNSSGFSGRELIYIAVAGVALASLYLWRLASLAPGISATEKLTATTPLGWHGIYHHPFYLSLAVLRSVAFKLVGQQHISVLRAPNVLIGLLAVAGFIWIVYHWHSNRTALLTSLLFATSAWVLHSSRLASFDTLYLVATPLLLAFYIGYQEKPSSRLWHYGSLLLWGVFLYVPGLIWVVLYMIYMQRSAIREGWRTFSHWHARLFYIFCGLIWLPLLIWRLRDVSILKLWLGLPAHFGSYHEVIKQFIAVPVHLFVRGPQYPEQWLGRLPILDVFTLAACLIGLYFYATNLKAGRSRLLIGLFILGLLTTGLHGAVSLSLAVPLLYIFVAAGLAYLLREWLQKFPFNPLARSIGVGVILIAVGLSCWYNLRSYYIAWPHNSVTKATFRERP